MFSIDSWEPETLKTDFIEIIQKQKPSFEQLEVPIDK